MSGWVFMVVVSVVAQARIWSMVAQVWSSATPVAWSMGSHPGRCNWT
ncbi:MAG: hypothetical protein FWF25_02430 [Propionibacteriaceae bacterium]|nr:hypothetical protein [Propionibacteriaceae bacterium]